MTLYKSQNLEFEDKSAFLVFYGDCLWMIHLMIFSIQYLINIFNNNSMDNFDLN